METTEKTVVIDSDAHVVESSHTWDYMDESERQYRPIPLETRENAGVKFPKKSTSISFLTTLFLFILSVSRGKIYDSYPFSLYFNTDNGQWLKIKSQALAVTECNS